MADNRMWLEHVDTGKRVLLAKFSLSQGWWAVNSAEDKMGAAFDQAARDGRTYADGPTYQERCWRLVYEHGAPDAVPPNRVEP